MGTVGASAEHVHAAGILRIGTMLVGAARAFKAHQDEQREAAEAGDEADQKQPSPLPTTDPARDYGGSNPE